MAEASTLCEGSGTRYVITLPKFRSMTVSVPSDKAEQTAIASILSDMDEEIAALESRREKTKALKQGMMQELLTGRIRLVDSGELIVDSEGDLVDSGELIDDSCELTVDSGRDGP